MGVPQQAHLRDQLGRLVIVIPSLQPDQRLVDLVRSLAEFPFLAIVVVNDGSEEQYDPIFARVSAIPPAIVLRHDVNRGQGCAVKSAIRFVLDRMPHAAGIVTADADGQHAVKDIVRIAEAIAADGDRPILGVRAFGGGVPLRSRVGNILTQYVFAALSGTMISDTQSGLRGIPARWLPTILRVQGDRFEFAVSLLANLCWLRIPPIELPVETIYIEGNRSSHFKPIRDSVRIYLFLLRLYAASLLPICVDLAAFALAFAATASIGIAVLSGRAAAVASLLLIYLVRRLRHANAPDALAKRLASLILTGCLSFGLIWTLAGRLHWNVFVAKIVAEFTLALASRILAKPAPAFHPPRPAV